VISAASLALADARLEMRDLVAACSLVCICKSALACGRAVIYAGSYGRDVCADVPQSRVDDALLLDPTPEEAHRQQASALLAHMPLANLVRAFAAHAC